MDFIAGPVSLHHAAEAYTPFSDEEVRRLERFTDRVRALGNSSFFEHPGHRMKATFTQGYVFDVRVDSPGEEAVRAVMPLFRELYTDENPTSARAVLTSCAATPARAEPWRARRSSVRWRACATL